MVTQFKILKILSALVGNAPAYSIAADVSRFPAGTFPMNVWLSQTNFRRQFEHFLVTRSKVPTLILETSTMRLKQNLQIENRIVSADSNTR